MNQDFDEAVTEVRARDIRPVQPVSVEEFDAYRAYTDLIAHARDYAEGSANRRLRLAEQLLVVVDQMWGMLPRHEDDPAARPQELSGRIAQLRSYVNTEHALNGWRRS